MACLLWKNKFVLLSYKTLIICVFWSVLKPPASFLQAMEEYVRDAPRSSTVHRDSVCSPTVYMLMCLPRKVLLWKKKKKKKKEGKTVIVIYITQLRAPTSTSWSSFQGQFWDSLFRETILFFPPGFFKAKTRGWKLTRSIWKGLKSLY